MVVSELDGIAPAAQPVEIVERKGLGHPDTLCDALAEEVSLALSRFYRERFGFVLHHNVDKKQIPNKAKQNRLGKEGGEREASLVRGRVGPGGRGARAPCAPQSRRAAPQALYRRVR